MSAIAINNVFYVVEDIERARRFYKKVLGLEILFSDGNKWTQMRLGHTKLALSSPEEAGPVQAGATVVFEVDDIDQSRIEISAAGGSILGERDMGNHGYLLVARDTEANILHLWKRHKG